MPRKHVVFLAVLVGGLLLDQITKIAVYTQLAPITGPNPDRIVLIPGILDIIHAQNPGAAFSFLASFEYRHAVFLAFTLVALVFVGTQQRLLAADDRWRSAALGLIASGALGNGIDRVHKRTVTDFIRMYVDYEPARSWLIDWFGTYEWPTYNVADVALLVGIVLLVALGDPSPEQASTTPDGVEPDDGPADPQRA